MLFTTEALNEALNLAPQHCKLLVEVGHLDIFKNRVLLLLQLL